jgi:hypothetical protein
MSEIVKRNAGLSSSKYSISDHRRPVQALTQGITFSVVLSTLNMFWDFGITCYTAFRVPASTGTNINGAHIKNSITTYCDI